MTKNNETHIFDDVFRTMEEHTPELMLPLVLFIFVMEKIQRTKKQYWSVCRTGGSWNMQFR